MTQSIEQENKRMLIIILGIVALMVGVSFAAVPAYRLFCQVTGFGGTTQTAQSLPDKVLDREITVRFNAVTAPDLPWVFKPDQRKINVKLGARGLTAYTAKNRSHRPVSGTAIYNVTPLKAGKYFHKIQCFCFDEQTLAAGEEVNMPVLFFVDPAMDDDPNMNDVESITLSYTFYAAESKALNKGLEAYYEADE